MTQNEIRVGIVGASAEKSWAKVSRVAGIKGLPGLGLAAMALVLLLQNRGSGRKWRMHR
jgi:hypothetical protein